MDYKQGQRVYIIIPPNIEGFEAKAAFQIIQATFLFAQNDKISAKVELNSPLLEHTMIQSYEDNVYTNLKDAIDNAYDHYNKQLKDAVDNRPDTSASEHNEVV